MWPDSSFAPAVPSFPVPVPIVEADPDEGTKINVCFNQDWLPYICGALQQLVLQATWDTQDPDELNLVQARAQLLISMFQEATMCCPCPVTRLVDGVSEYSHDGIHFYTYPGALEDPTFNAEPRWPPEKVPPGQDGACLSSANIVEQYRVLTQKLIDILTIEETFAAVLAGIINFTAAFIAPVTVFAFAADFAVAAIGAGIGVLEDSISSDNLDLLKCIINCAIADDGAITPAAFDEMRTQVTDQIGGLDALYINDYLGGLGPVGLTRQEATGITSADCDCLTCAPVTGTMLFGLGSIDSPATIEPGQTWTINSGNNAGLNQYCAIEFSRCIKATVLSYVGWVIDTAPSGNPAWRDCSNVDHNTTPVDQPPTYLAPDLECNRMYFEGLVSSPFTVTIRLESVV